MSMNGNFKATAASYLARRTNWGATIQTDRILDPTQNLCLVNPGYDTYMRPGCANSLVTLTEGCDTPLARVDVENVVQRPQYQSYLSLSAVGYLGDDKTVMPFVTEDDAVYQGRMKNLSDLSNKNSMSAIAAYSAGAGAGAGSSVQSRLSNRAPASSNPLYYSQPGQKLNIPAGAEPFQYDQNRIYQANAINKFAQISSAGYQNGQNFRASGMTY